MSRPRRAAAAPATSNANQSSSITVSRSPSDSPEDRRRSIKLTVKMPSSKLREVTSQSSVGRNVAVNSRDSFEAGEIMTGKRSTRAPEATKLREYNPEEDSEDWDESESEEDFGNLDPPTPVLMTSTSEEEDDDDEEFEEPPPPPPKQAQTRAEPKPAVQQKPKIQGKPGANPALIITPAAEGPIKSVEQKEMEMDNDDEELSELESNGQEEEQDETNIDAEGDVDDMGAEEDAEGDDDIDAEGEVESGDETPGSGTGTPKPQTKRQRGQDEGAFLALPMEPQIKKILTADEHRMRRAEMARRRKNLSEKRNEEEKVQMFSS